MRRLFLAIVCIVALLTKTDPQASQSRLGTIESIVDRGTYRLDDSTFINTIDKVFRDGHFYSHQPPLLSTLEAPVYWLLHLSGARFHNRGKFVITYAFTLLTNGLALALTVLVFADILAMASVGPPFKYALAVLLPLGTWLLPYGLVTNNHGISGLLMTALIWLLLKVEWQGATRSRAFAIGAVLGLVAGIEILPIVSFVPVTSIYLLSRRGIDARARWLFATGVATLHVALTTFRARARGAALVVTVAGAASVGSMAFVNFLIASYFRWPLLLLALLWVLALALYLFEGSAKTRA